MFSLISDCADHLVQYMEKIASKDEPVECRELTAKYTTDVIGSCVFGIEMNALSNEDSEFRKMGRKVFNPTLTSMLRIRIRQMFPWLYNMLGYVLPQTEVTKFFTRVIVENMDYRETNNITRNDFIDMLRELKKHPDKVNDIGTYIDPMCVFIYTCFFCSRKIIYMKKLRVCTYLNFINCENKIIFCFDHNNFFITVVF